MALVDDIHATRFSWLKSPNAAHWISFVDTDPPRQQFLGPAKMPGHTVANVTNIIGVKTVRPERVDMSRANCPQWQQNLPNSAYKIPEKLRMSHAHIPRSTRMQYW
jgi:hypothetical protein